jgi:hypothetical protein
MFVLNLIEQKINECHQLINDLPIECADWKDKYPTAYNKRVIELQKLKDRLVNQYQSISETFNVNLNSRNIDESIP